MKKICALFALLLLSSSCSAMSAGRRLFRSLSKKTLRAVKPLHQAEELDPAVKVQFVQNYELSWVLNEEVDYINPEETDPFRCLYTRRTELTFILLRRLRQSDRTFCEDEKLKLNLEINYIKRKIDEITRQIQESCNNE